MTEVLLPLLFCMPFTVIPLNMTSILFGRLQGRHSQEWLNLQNRLIDCSDTHKCMNPVNLVSKTLTFVSIIGYYFSVFCFKLVSFLQCGLTR